MYLFTVAAVHISDRDNALVISKFPFLMAKPLRYIILMELETEERKPCSCRVFESSRLVRRVPRREGKSRLNITCSNARLQSKSPSLLRGIRSMDLLMNQRYSNARQSRYE